MRLPLDKLGSTGAVIAAAACPVCFPKLALVGAFFGLGGLAAYESQLIVAAQLLVLIAAAGHVLAWRRHRSKWRLGAALGGAAAFFAGMYVAELLAYAGLAALVAASIPRLAARGPKLSSTLTCPDCGHRQTETMPTDACQFFYECKRCGKVLRPKAGDCCVFCSYGSVKCPPVQAAKPACAP